MKPSGINLHVGRRNEKENGVMVKTRDNNELAKDVTKLLNDQGVLIKEKTVKMVIEGYMEKKAETLSKGISVKESGIGRTDVSFRRTNTFGNFVIPLVKINVDFDEDLKNRIKKGIVESEEVKNNVSDRIEESDIEFFRKDLGL